MAEQELKILIVDDESAIRDLFSDLLTHEGYQVTKADSGEEAIKKLKQSPHHIVFIDMRMPGMNGLQTFLALKETDPKIVGVIVTGYAVNPMVREALSKEAFCCIYKPFDIDEILEVIKNIRDKLKI